MKITDEELREMWEKVGTGEQSFEEFRVAFRVLEARRKAEKYRKRLMAKMWDSPHA